MVGALAVVAAALVAVQLAGASPASAVTGIQKVTGPVSATDSQPSKTVRADCPAGTRVIGGGGWAFNVTTVDQAKVALTAMEPVHPASGPDSYVVSGQSVNPSTNSGWWLQAYAICAAPIPGMHIVSATSAAKAVDQDVFCPAHEAPFGGGGRVNNPANHVSLQGVGPNGGRIFTLAMPDTASYTGTWSITSYAVCGRPPVGYEKVQTKSTSPATDPVHVAVTFCSAGKLVHSAFAGIEGPTRPGLAISAAFPSNALNLVQAVAVDTASPGVAWRPVVSMALCAN
jgi:hypothetical protein